MRRAMTRRATQRDHTVTEAKSKKTPKATPPRRGPTWLDRAVRALVMGVLRIGLFLGLAVGAILAVAVFAMYSTLPPADALRDGRDRGSVTLLDRHDTVFAWRGDQFGGEVSPGDVSPHLVHAILAAEDHRFYGHFGVDPIGLARALVVNARAGRVVQGGSTITQQVAKNSFLTNERSIERKLKEIPMALAMELKYSKDDILAVYLNRVYLGAGTYGFEAASRRYFGKSARAVTPAEAAMLAGLLKAPSRFAPTANIERSRNRAALVLRRMHDEGWLTDAQLIEATAQPAALAAGASATVGAQYADWIMESAPDWLTRNTAEDVVIRTSFDPAAQRAAEAALAQVFADKVRPGSQAEAAIVVMTPDGAVRAIVGGRDGDAGSFNRATQAARQPGSAFKPFVYAAAIERGVTPFDRVEDAPLTMRGWSPKNYGGGYSGSVTVAEAFSRSLNTPAVRLSERVGRDAVRKLAAKTGLDATLIDAPALALGVSEVTLLDLAGAYAVFANGGFEADPWGVRDIRARGVSEPLMQADHGPRRRVLAPNVAGLTTWLMRGTVLSGTGRRAALPGRQAAGKTGTTQEARDAWFVGFTADYVIGVWMGYDDNRPLTGVTGGGLPAEIWRETALRLHEGLPPRGLTLTTPAPPAEVVAAAPPAPPRAPEASGGILGGILSDVIEALTR